MMTHHCYDVITHLKKLKTDKFDVFSSDIDYDGKTHMSFVPIYHDTYVNFRKFYSEQHIW